MTLKPKWLTRPKILAFGLALVAAGYFAPIYKIAEQTFGVAETTELFKWILAAKEETEASTNAPPVIVTPDAPQPTQPAIVDDLDISNVKQVGSNNGLPRLTSIPALHTINSARVEGSNVRLSYNVPSSYWSSQSDHMKFARGWVFWQDGGQVYGAHYDWYRPGQTVKTLGNLYNGYVTRRPVGRLYFALIANDQSARTNVKGAQ
jgi:hypothetical protein